jgi:hypothetical protein
MIGKALEVKATVIVMEDSGALMRRIRALGS